MARKTICILFSFISAQHRRKQGHMSGEKGLDILICVKGNSSGWKDGGWRNYIPNEQKWLYPLLILKPKKLFFFKLNFSSIETNNPIFFLSFNPKSKKIMGPYGNIAYFPGNKTK